MPAPKKYPDDCENTLGCPARDTGSRATSGIGDQSLRPGAKQADIDDGRRPGTTTRAEAFRIAEVERDNREPRPLNDIVPRPHLFLYDFTLEVE